MKIGIPRALLYYKYKDLWNAFFSYFETIELVYSENTNKRVIRKGSKYSIDESCLSSKIFMGHVHDLIGKCDYILVPRIVSFGKKEEVCPKFNGLPDIVQNTFPKAKIVTYDVDVNRRKTEKRAFVKMGRELGLPCERLSSAYENAKDIEKKARNIKVVTQEKKLKEKNMKVLIVSHPYNTYDDYIGGQIISFIRSLDVIPIFADQVYEDEALRKSKRLSKRLYWTFNKVLLGGIEIYKKKIDGILLISSFPCGPDSLVNELIIRKVKNKPILNLVVDEQDGLAGIETRIESFIDIIRRKNGNEK